MQCVGMVGKLPTPKGSTMFYDTGRQITPVQLAEVLALQHSVSNSNGETRERAILKIIETMTKVANEVNVYPVGQAALAGDGRILVTEPWFESYENQD